MAELREKLHIVGCVVYEELLSPELQRTAMEMFLQMDSNKDGSVSLQELTHHCASNWQAFVGKMFRLLDVDNSGSLDFDECKALFFLGLCNASWGSSAWRLCDSCGDSVLDSIYTCSACLSQRNAYFDLCSTCYPAALGSHVPAHHRSQFERHDLKVASVMETILAEVAREISPPTYNSLTVVQNNMHFQEGSSKAITPSRNNASGGRSMRTTSKRVMQGLNIAAQVSTVVSACSIM